MIEMSVCVYMRAEGFSAMKPHGAQRISNGCMPPVLSVLHASLGVCCTNKGGERVSGAASGERGGDRRVEGGEEQHPGE